MYKFARVFCAAVCVMSWGYVMAQTEFSADIVNDNHQNAPSARMYFGKDKMRIESKGSDPRGGVVLLDMTAQTSMVLMPQQHMYVELPMQNTMRRNMNLFHVQDVDNACGQWLEMPQNKGGSCHKVGNETVNGRNTVKYEGTNAKGESATVWIDPKLRFPVKWQGSKGDSGEMTNIQEGSQPASLFEIPSGYQKMDMGEMMMKPPQQ